MRGEGAGSCAGPGGREGEGGFQTPDRGPGARRPPSAASSPPPGSCLAATGTSARVSTARLGPGFGLAPLVPGSSGMEASPGKGARAWALSSSPREAPETAPPPGPSCLGRDGFQLNGLGQPQRWKPALGLSGVPRARVRPCDSTHPLSEDPIARQHVDSAGRALFLVLCVAHA